MKGEELIAWLPLAMQDRQMPEKRPHPELFIRLYLTPEQKLGPGKVALLELIDQTGSISAAGRSMGMSYKRAWMLVETMNEMFRDPLVESSRGGASGGGATLTETGREVLRLFRLIEAEVAEASSASLGALRSLSRNDE